MDSKEIVETDLWTIDSAIAIAGCTIGYIDAEFRFSKRVITD